MADEREKIEQIRARRGRDQVTVGVNPYDLSSAAAVSGPGGADDNILGVDFKSPWLRDRVTLSTEAQIALIEQRASARPSMADLGYANRTLVQPMRKGVFLKIEPTGCYRLSWNNRA
jgi:hypothetical protein